MCVMKKVFTFLFASALACFQSGCAGNKTANDSNSANANLETKTETNQANINAKAAETPLPTFTNADEALAEGKKLLDAIETEKAIDALNQAVKLNPDLAEAYFNLGIAYSLVEKDEEEVAKEEIEPTPTPKQSGKVKKNAPPVRTKYSEKAFEKAVAAYKKIVAKNPKDDVAQFNLGRALNKLNEDEDAMKALRQAVKLKPDDAEYQTNYGAILMKLAQYDEAVAALKKANNLDADNIQIKELLEKAEAGQRRVGFSTKPKLPQQQQKQQQQIKRPDNTNSQGAANTKPKEQTPPKTANANK